MKRVKSCLSYKLWIISAVLLLILFPITGCDNKRGISVLSNKDKSQILADARPYLKEIRTDDINLRRIAIPIVSSCASADKECQINKIYREIADKYKYRADPRNNGLIQDPSNTIRIRGGDCEDLTILMMSLLENIGIDTYLVLTKNHAYALACGIDVDSLQEEIIISMNKKETLYEEQVLIEAESAKYYGGKGQYAENPFIISYSIVSDQAIDTELVPSGESLQAWANNKEYESFTECSKKNIFKVFGDCKMNRNGGVLLINNNTSDAKVSIKIEVTYNKIKEIIIHKYSFNDKECIALDPTLGENGYPGYGVDISGEKIAIDPISQEYVFLK